MQWESTNWLQKRFMKWFNKERLRAMLTFPVETVNLLDNGTEYVDKEWEDFAAEMWAEGHSFFMYRSNSVDSLASCCFAPNTKILAKSSNGVHYITIKELYDMKWADKKNLTVYHNGSWVRAKTIKLPKRQMYQVETANKKLIEVTDNHLWPTLRGLKRTDELNEDDYLMFNTRELNAVPEKDRKLSYVQGYLIGMYLGDGSIERKDNKYFTVHYSLNKEKYESCITLMNAGLTDCNIEDEFKLGKPYNNVYPTYLYSSELTSFIDEYVEGNYAQEKHLKPEVYLQSVSFREGILDGFYATDGGNNNRIYTTSKILSEDIEALCATLGIQTIIDISDRTDEPIIIRSQNYNRNYPLYCIRWYSPNNKRSNENIYKIVNNSIYFKIIHISEVETNYDNVYCFECFDQDEPYFTLPSGLITHNCRLKNEIQDNQFSYTLGAGGISTGSKCVMTININRIIQETFKQNPEWDREHFWNKDIEKKLIVITDAVRQQVSRVHTYLKAFNTILLDRYKAGLLPLYDAGFVDPKRQYLTVGINGLIEGAEFLNCKIKPDDNYYKQFTNEVLKTIHELNVKDRTDECMFNTEYVPAENLGVKNAKWDKQDGLVVPRPCYNSYFYLVEDTSTNMLDKFILHGKEFTQYLDGGSALHGNLEEHLTKDQYKKLMQFAIKTGCPYFTFNIPNTVCKDCGYISKHKLLKCPKCNSENLDYATRVIGYLKLVSSFSEDRQKEEHRRFYFNQ